MTRRNWIVLCLAYIIGLLFANAIAFSPIGINPKQLGVLAAGSIALATIGAIALGRIKPRWVWAVAAVVTILGAVYFQLRIPHPSNNDISYQITSSESQLVTVTGTVLTEPRLNQNQRIKFVLEAAETDRERVSGKLYATIPLLQATGLYPGKPIKLTGILYLPQAATNPGGFDFKQYLARQGIFAGIRGTEVSFLSPDEPFWGWWKIRRRIVRSQLRGLGSPIGQLVSSMVLGRKAVDLPSEIRDRFIEAGLAHVLAASGFHVSLLLGIIIKLTDRFTTKSRLIVGIGTLVIYLGLTGIQASVFRACLMGMAVLIALAMETKVKPLGSLLLAATIILLYDPLYIGDLGFQLSFLATFGLIVTIPELQAKLDWLPPTVAALIAVPLAASIWVLPLLSYTFNTIATYSIVVNIVCTPLITIISLGGMISAIAALIFPSFGAAIASLLFYPTQILIAVVEFFTNLPGSTWAIGQISLSALLTIYGLLILVWLHRWWSKRWWLALWLVVILIAVTLFSNSNRLQITVLDAQKSQIVVVRDRDRVILINSGRDNQAKYTVLPFLARQGINQIDYAIALDNSSNSETEWEAIVEQVHIEHIIRPIDTNYLQDRKIENSPPATKISTNSVRLEINQQLSVINLQIADCVWLIISKPSETKSLSRIEIAQYIEQHDLNFRNPVIVGSADSFSNWMELLQPQMAIASANNTDILTRQLHQQQTELHNTAEAGAIYWTPTEGFITQEYIME